MSKESTRKLFTRLDELITSIQSEKDEKQRNTKLQILRAAHEEMCERLIKIQTNKQ